MRTSIFATTLLTMVLLLAAGAVQAGHFVIAADGKSEVVFTSKALWEKFDGKTRDVSGFVDADLNNLKGPVTLEVTVDLASFDTGMKKRNQHMRENHLETDTYPTATFKAGRVLEASPASLAAGTTGQLVVEGVLDLHGVQKTYEVPLTVELAADGSLRVRGEFAVMLEDHAIERPQKLVVKLAEKQEVKIDLRARPAS